MRAPDTQLDSTRRIGRYLVSAPIASGGMATVHFGALVGQAGFSRTVAVKRLHTDRRSRQLVTSLLDEARLVSRVKHPNVVPILDVVTDGGEVLVILEYVVGETLSSLLRASERAGEPVPVDYAVAIVAAVLHGLHAAHEATTVGGEPLGIVHRDVSPQNVMVGVDGLARVLDFGIAKATERLSKSMAGQIKGKLAYMSPEQIRGQTDRRTDIYAAAVVLWELLAGRRLFPGVMPGELIQLKLAHEVSAPSQHRQEVTEALDGVVLRALAERPGERFATAKDFALQLEEAAPPVRPTDVGAWVQKLAGDKLERRARIVADLERAAAALTGEAPSFALSSRGGEDGGAFTEDVASSDDAVVAAETDEGDRLPSMPPGPAALASEGTGDGPERTAVSAGVAAKEATHTEVVVSMPDPGDEESPTLAAGTASAGDVSTSMGLQADIAGRWDLSSSERRRRLGVMLLFVLFGAAVGVLWFRGRQTVSSAVTTLPVVGEPSAVESAPSPSNLSSSKPPSTAAPAASASSDAETVAVPTPTAIAPTPWPPTQRPPAVASPPTAAPSPASPKGCDPPYVVDDRGVRRLKPECM